MSNIKCILIVDDSEFDRLLMVKMLSKQNEYKAISCSSGVECLEIINSMKIDLVLLDIVMPGNFGPQILKLIREKYNQIELPVIMISGKDDTTDITGSLHLGANDYIIKPINFNIAMSRISTHLRFADLSLELSKLQEIAALHAMVTTYNHEINNPLSIAIGFTEKLLSKYPEEEELKVIENSLWRVVEVLKKIDAIPKGKIDYDQYTIKTKMIKLE